MSESKPRYTVYIDDHFHYMDESYRVTHGSFSSYREARAAAAQIVEDCVRRLKQPDDDASSLTKKYLTFGDDPWIDEWDRAEPKFSALHHAKTFIAHLLNDTR